MRTLHFALWFLLLSFFFIPRLISAVAEWMSTILLHNGVALVRIECRSEMCCIRLAGNTGRKNDAKNRHLGTIVQFCRAESSQLTHVSTIGKNFLNNNTSATCPHNTVNFSLLAAEIGLVVWGTPEYFIFASWQR